MASPAPAQAQASTSNQPLTPPAEPSSTNNTANTAASSQPPHPTGTTTTTTAPNTAMPSTTPQPTLIPSTSLTDSGKSRRPRDVRLIHMLLASLGVTAYQERVPLQLLDFAYRYTSGILQDAVHLATEGYAGATDAGPSSSRGPVEVNSVTLPALRLSIASRLHYQFQTGLPKEFLMDVASERNRVALPGASRGFDAGQAKSVSAANQSVIMGGMRLPPERFCLTGTGWNMKDEWESEGEEEVEDAAQAGPGPGPGPGPGQDTADGALGGVKEEGDENMGEGDDEDGKMEDIFGEDTAMGEGEGDEDKAMMDV